MSSPRCWQGQAPRASLLHPVWQPVSAGEPWQPDEGGDPQTFVARCLLGAGWVGASRRLSVLDLRTYAALVGLLSVQLPAAPPEDLTLANADRRTVETTGYRLCEMVFKSADGRDYERLRKSLGRLMGARVWAQSVEPDAIVAARRVTTIADPLIGRVTIARDELRLPNGESQAARAQRRRGWATLTGSVSLGVEIGRWTAQQAVAGKATWLDLDLLRALGSGLPARLWAALEAWGRWPAHTMDGREEAAIGLGEPARQSLGVGEYRRPDQARAALNRAGARICAVDPAYELMRCEKRAGWCLVVRRLSGAKGRAQARSGAPWRSPGIAASKRQRPGRVAVRAQLRASLADGTS